MSCKIFKFGFGAADGDLDIIEVLGGKGANLCHMAKAGFPVPEGVIIPAGYSIEENASHIVLTKEVVQQLRIYEEQAGKPLLWSVRSGAKVSMPGMMDTILNVGLDPYGDLDAYITAYGERTVYDSLRRFVQMYGSVVLGMEEAVFEAVLQRVKTQHKVESDAELSVEALREVVDAYLLLVKEDNKTLPSLLETQIMMCIAAVWRSWNNDRAIAYRALHGIPHTMGTAVVIQRMVFGNLNEQSCSGVLFTRNPDTGVKGVIGEFLPNAQGEDVVAGIRTPKPLSEMKQWNPKAHKTLVRYAKKAEAMHKDMQDMEFTVEDGQVFLLQTRRGKRSAKAAFKIAHDLFFKEGVLTPSELRERISADDYRKLRGYKVTNKQALSLLASGLPAGGEWATGIACFTAEDAIELNKLGKSVILITKETTPEDFEGLVASVGILTQTGGVTSHAAVVARGLNKTCVVGCSSITAIQDGTVAIIEGTEIKVGDPITLNGRTGEVYFGKATLKKAPLNKVEARVLQQLCGWVEGALLSEDPCFEAPVRCIKLDWYKTKKEFLAAYKKAVKYAERVVVDCSFFYESSPYNTVRALYAPIYIHEKKLYWLKGWNGPLVITNPSTETLGLLAGFSQPYEVYDQPIHHEQSVLFAE